MAPHIPKPFERPSIALPIGENVRKSWQTTTADKLSVGDILKGEGAITHLAMDDDDAHDPQVGVRTANGFKHFFAVTDKVEAFTKTDG